MMTKTTRRAAFGSLFGALLAASCGGGSSSSDGASGFQLRSISLMDGAVWELNREIVFEFSEAVDFSTVNLNTINIQTPSGTPATGSFFVRRVDADGDGIRETPIRSTIIFQPTCPTLADFSDAGLKAGGVTYRLTVPGANSGASNTVRSRTGVRLTATQTRIFSTPLTTTDPSAAFVDTVQGAPVPVIRNVNAPNSLAGTPSSYIEIGGDNLNREDFVFDPVTQTFSTATPGFEAPLNLYSDETSRVAVILEFNQPVSPEADNISSDFLRLEYLNNAGDWLPIDTRVELVANCTQSGATARLQPVGVLPVAGMFRAVVRAGFRDLVGDRNAQTIDGVATAPTRTVRFQSLTPADEQSDGQLEEFLVGGEDLESFEDTEAIFESPTAVWGGGSLSANFAFQGTGGPNGDFDWVIPANATVNFDTTSTQIIGGPGGIPAGVQNAIGGVVDVRDLIVEQGATLRILGPNVMQVNAARNVIIKGTIDVSGVSAKDVATLGTANQAEKGGAGAAGGGAGGNASTVLNNSTPCGDTGFGAFQEPGGGGQGGEMGYRNSSSKEERRPGGGGGGRFGPDRVFVDPDTMLETDRLEAHAGNNGHPRARGAKSGQTPPRGGAAGLGPFLDPRDDNDFFGVRPVDDGSGLRLIVGELGRLFAGAGGGGGGDAAKSDTWPTPRWTPGSDEKGGGGGGGAGGMIIKALGRILFVHGNDARGNPFHGRIVANGGKGAAGENTNFLDHIGGSGGSGSGGHIVLESAQNIDFTVRDGDLVSEPIVAPVVFYIEAFGGPEVRGEERTNPVDLSNGGQGGPGVVQMHVPDALRRPGTDPNRDDIIVPTSAAADEDPLARIAAPGGTALRPSFGARSRARSDWISIGGADQNPSGPPDRVCFLFEGVETADGDDQGKILAPGGEVEQLPPLIGPTTLARNPNIALDPDGVTLEISGALLDPIINDPTTPVANDIYLRAPKLLRNFLLRLDIAEPGNEQIFRNYDVVDASYDDDGMVLTLVVDDTVLGSIQSFIDGNPGLTAQLTLIPRFFRVVTGGIPNDLPESAFVRVRFQATTADVFGRPEDDPVLIDWTGDIADLNDPANSAAGEIQFFRYEVEFDLSADMSPLSVDTRPVTLDFLRIPFKF